ncbi:MAG: nucleotide exchange factor GrpE [Halobacteriales archaeon]|nr:nucleotide exchange factor GrpE [Halobacteriales archaeon]
MGDAESTEGDDQSTEEREEPTEEPAASVSDVSTDPEALTARVAAFDEELAAVVAELADGIDERDEEIAELESRLKRTHADFQNYKKRVERREEQLRQRATEDLVSRLLDVRDNLARALDQDADAEIRDGVEATLASFDRALGDEGVTAIEPEPGDEVDPTVHEVVMRVAGSRPDGTIEEVYRPGYELGDKVLRPAQVTVSEGDESDDEE